MWPNFAVIASLLQEFNEMPGAEESIISSWTATHHGQSGLGTVTNA